MCGGVGKKITSKCHVCHADKVVKSIDELLLYIEKGIPNGHIYTYKEAADEFTDIQSGDVLFEVETLPHKIF